MSAFGQWRQIHFYAASLLPGKTICSHCGFRLHPLLLELLLEMTGHQEDLESSRFRGDESSRVKRRF